MSYTITKAQLQTPILKRARHIARDICLKNAPQAVNDSIEEGNNVRVYNKHYEIISSVEGYPIIHDIIFSTLENQSDPSASHYKGLYSELLKENITFESLRHLLSDNAEQTSIESLEPPLSDSTEKTSIENPEDLLNHKAEKTYMALPFFRALDPTSKNSGITYCLARNSDLQGSEMLDYTVDESITDAFNHNLDFLAELNAIYNILVGTHYDLDIKGHGEKGLLDYLILPLVARKLIADACLEERSNNIFANILAWTVAIPIELARFSAACALTLLLAPVIGLVHLVKACMSKEEVFVLEPEADQAAYSF